MGNHGEAMGATLQLRGGDARAALAFAGDVATCRDAAQLDAQIATLPRLVGSDGVIVTDCRDWASDVVLEVGDPRVYRPELLGVIGREWREHPVLTRDLAREAHGARKISDFVDARTWRRRALFNDFYRPLGMTRELAAQMSWGPAGSTCCVALHRAGRDFSERDRAMLALVSPHLRAARARLAADARLARALTLVERGHEDGGRGALLVGQDGDILAAGARADELLERWFGGSPRTLPRALAAWRASAGAGTAPPALDLARGERRLRARLVRGRDEDVMLLTERDDTIPLAQRLARVLPITRREADVLARLAAGRTNDGIAQDLGISRHTAIRHVEHLYVKLGVHTRSAATRAALDALRDDG